MRVTILFLLSLSVLEARGREVTADWSGLSKEVEGRSVTVRGAEGQRWKGRVDSVTGAGLVLVGRKGSETVPREAVHQVEFQRWRGSRGRVIGTAVGAGAGAPVVWFAEVYQHNEGYSARIRFVAIGIAAAATAIGYFIGRDVDRERVVVRVTDASPVTRVPAPATIRSTQPDRR